VLSFSVLFFHVILCVFRYCCVLSGIVVCCQVLLCFQVLLCVVRYCCVLSGSVLCFHVVFCVVS